MRTRPHTSDLALDPLASHNEVLVVVSHRSYKSESTKIYPIRFMTVESSVIRL